MRLPGREELRDGLDSLSGDCDRPWGFTSGREKSGEYVESMVWFSNTVDTSLVIFSENFLCAIMNMKYDISQGLGKDVACTTKYFFLTTLSMYTNTFNWVRGISWTKLQGKNKTPIPDCNDDTMSQIKKGLSWLYDRHYEKKTSQSH